MKMTSIFTCDGIKCRMDDLLTCYQAENSITAFFYTNCPINIVHLLVNKYKPKKTEMNLNVVK